MCLCVIYRRGNTQARTHITHTSTDRREKGKHNSHDNDIDQHILQAQWTNDHTHTRTHTHSKKNINNNSSNHQQQYILHLKREIN